jgi:hypothetical protein
MPRVHHLGPGRGLRYCGVGFPASPTLAACGIMPSYTGALHHGSGFVSRADWCGGGRIKTPLLAFQTGLLAGLRSLTPPAATAWAAHLGWLKLRRPLSRMGTAPAAVIFSPRLAGARKRQVAKNSTPYCPAGPHRPHFDEFDGRVRCDGRRSRSGYGGFAGNCGRSGRNLRRLPGARATREGAWHAQLRCCSAGRLRGYWRLSLDRLAVLVFSFSKRADACSDHTSSVRCLWHQINITMRS